MIKHLPEDILFEGVTYQKGETEMPLELEEFVGKLNKMVNPQLEPEEPAKVQSRKAK